MGVHAPAKEPLEVRLSTSDVVRGGTISHWTNEWRTGTARFLVPAREPTGTHSRPDFSVR